MPTPIESATWLGAAKSKVKLSQVDNGIWLGKAEAAKLLKVSPRQLERRAQEGYIARQYLPRLPNERSTRVVFSRADIEAFLRGEFPAKLDLPKPDDLDVNLPRKPRPKPAPAVSVLDQRMENYVAALSQRIETSLAALRPQSAPESPALAKYEAMMQAQDAIIDAQRRQLDALVLPAPAAPAPKPWLTLDEAAEYSGLPKAWLLSEARKIGGSYGTYQAERCVNVINVGTEKRARWMFNREALAR